MRPMEHEAIAAQVNAWVENCREDPRELLAMLRLLEGLHRDIREGPFREALPTNRQALYALLRDMEAEGGWPYIPRLRLRSLLAWMEEQEQRGDGMA